MKRRGKRLLKVLFIIVGVLVLVGALLAVFGLDLYLMSIEPSASFEASDAPTAPRYEEETSWAAHPEHDDRTSLVPEGLAEATQRDADVFFIHPTAYLGGDLWNGPVDEPVGKELIDEFVLANQASVFNGCCRVFAPRYRSATLYGFTDPTPSTLRSFDLAYEDVERAFQHYLEHESDGRPFVLAGHSQGSMHLVRLLHEVIDGTQLQERLVAAYAIGWQIPIAALSSLQTLSICNGPADTGCVMSWNAFREGGEPHSGLLRPQTWSDDGWRSVEPDEEMLCTHPYSFRPGDTEMVSSNDGDRAAAQSTELVDPADMLFGTPSGVQIEALPAPFDPEIRARCDEGFLYVTGLTDPRFDATVPIDPEGALHAFDYNLFYVSVRDDAIARTRQHLERAGGDRSEANRDVADDAGVGAGAEGVLPEVVEQ